MDVKEAARTALDYVADLFEQENIMDLGLEEVEQDQTGAWRVTVGFSRPWDYPKGNLAVLGGGQRARSYKVVRIVDDKVLSVKNREV
jgi:hypothetical protein